MKDNIKIGLLAVIAITLIANTLFGSGSDKPSRFNADGFNSAAAAPGQGNAGSEANPIQVDPNFNQANTPDQATPPPPATPALPKTSMTFGKTDFDFGTVKQNSENKHVFKFTNTGDQPLQISDAKGSCGCTVPTYPKEPIMPGATGEIEVVYKPGTQADAQTKNVTITANTEPTTSKLVISANVVPE